MKHHSHAFKRAYNYLWLASLAVVLITSNILLAANYPTCSSYPGQPQVNSPNNNYCPKLEGQTLLRCCPEKTVQVQCTYSYTSYVSVTSSYSSSVGGCSCTNTPPTACCATSTNNIQCATSVVTETQTLPVTWQGDAGGGCCVPSCNIPTGAVQGALQLCSDVSGGGDSCSGETSCGSVSPPPCNCPGTSTSEPPPPDTTELPPNTTGPTGPPPPPPPCCS